MPGVMKRAAQYSPFRAACAANRASFTIGTENTNAINIAVQLQDANANNAYEHVSLFCYLSDDANGNSIATSAPTGGVVIGTNGLAIPVVTNKAFQVTSESDGSFDLTITDSGTPTFYLVLVMPDGSLVVSGAITFA